MQIVSTHIGESKHMKWYLQMLYSYPMNYVAGGIVRPELNHELQTLANFWGHPLASYVNLYWGSAWLLMVSQQAKVGKD